MTARALPKFMVLLAPLFAGGLAVSMRNDEEEIRTYTVARPESPSRLLGAIIPRGEQAWFFKLTGPNQVVAEQGTAFRELIKSLKFDESSGEPSWTLPSGWSERPGTSIRFATLQVEVGGEKLDCSVTKLPMTDPDLPTYLLANINRWRDQLRVAKISANELASSTSQLKLNRGELTATLVEFTGEMAPSPMAPMASASTTSERPPMAGASRAVPADKLNYKVPLGWKPGPLEISRGGITVPRAAAFEVQEGEQRVEITVTKLPISGMLGNVNRWRAQIGLGEITINQLEQVKKQIEFAGRPADYVQFAGEKEAILGVVSIAGDDVWFVKLQGNTELATRERENFEQFVKSIRF